MRDLPPLPPGKTVVSVLADFLSYLFSCAKRYICETHAAGDSLWASFEDRIEFVLSHPNGWEGLQQGKMREAAAMAGLVPSAAAGDAHVHFVTEGEASLNFCIQSGLADETMRVRRIFHYGLLLSINSVITSGRTECYHRGRWRRDRRYQQLWFSLHGSSFRRGSHLCRL